MLSIGKLVVLIRELLARWIFVDEVQGSSSAPCGDIDDV